ncbi:isopeptide-forming domain-containing fimbrial protein [Lactobacillus sp. ESL0679]|uniref:isopeptide-forming domain-containing fimbrial protein n=1 Tax=Lactobacillus sp. ESL0679 TaxID=2983209 RepID=UPI0023F69C4D|nr:isopeptide-forming domain-containing fimbrial protein [Lactobacillus sp. ESL0679]MDF7683756.1 isopeptide-forming domain-containing fimbrial protein [Lactobacillus sp. ESL0679]
MNLLDSVPNKKKYVKRISSSVVILLALSMGLGARKPTVVHADNAQMTDLPKSTNAAQNKIPGQYAFSARIDKGITEVKPFGATNSDWYSSSTHTEDSTHHWFAFKLSDNDGNNDQWKGKVGVYYSNVGVYNGHTIDIKLTMMDWKVQNYEWVDTNGNGKADTRKNIKQAYAAFGKDDFEIFTPGLGAVKYRLDYLDHKTHEPVKITGSWTFNDIDGDQWVGIEPNTFSNVDQIYYGDHDNKGNTWLSYKNMGGKNYIYSDANQHNTKITDNSGHNAGTLTSNQLKGSFTAAYSDSSSFIIDWVYGENTGEHAIKDQNDLESDINNWNMTGKYDPDADKEYPISDLGNSIASDMFNHAFLQFSTQPITPDKPGDPVKYVSDSDEGTNVPSEIGTDKSVDHDLLKNRYEEYHYQITHNVPKVLDRFKYTEYMITDDLDKDLDISNIHVYNRNNQDVTYMFTINVDSDNKLSVVAKGDALANDDFYREQYKVTFDGKVKPGVTLADHQDPKHDDQAVIYNDAKVTTSNGSADSNKTTTNIPFTPKNETKAVSADGKGDGKDLAVDFGQDYKYTVKVAAPDGVNIKSLELKDKLEPVLNLKDVHVYDLDDSNKDVTDQGKLTTDSNTADWVANDATKWHGKHLEMIITANVKNVPELMDYLDKDSGKIKVPNKAIFTVNGKDDPTNNVDVEPNSPKASVQKWIELPDLN